MLIMSQVCYSIFASICFLPFPQISDAHHSPSVFGISLARKKCGKPRSIFTNFFSFFFFDNERAQSTCTLLYFLAFFFVETVESTITNPVNF